MLEITISFDCKPKILENIRIIMSECISKKYLNKFSISMLKGYYDINWPITKHFSKSFSILLHFE
jgi:hypothetical protein